jgi:hypothetical protein
MPEQIAFLLGGTPPLYAARPIGKPQHLEWAAPLFQQRGRPGRRGPFDLPLSNALPDRPAYDAHPPSTNGSDHGRHLVCCVPAAALPCVLA